MQRSQYRYIILLLYLYIIAERIPLFMYLKKKD